MKGLSVSQKMSRGWGKKIAKKRGEKWRKSMIKGKREAMLSPSHIRLVRLSKGLEQQVLATRLNMALSTFGSIERGKRMVKKDAAQKIAATLGKPLAKLFKDAGKDKYLAITRELDL